MCVCVCVVHRKKEDERERDSNSQGGKTLLRFFFLPTSGPGPKVPQKTRCPDAPPVSFVPPQPTDLQNDKFTHSTMDRPANQ